MMWECSSLRLVDGRRFHSNMYKFSRAATPQQLHDACNVSNADVSYCVDVATLQLHVVAHVCFDLEHDTVSNRVLRALHADYEKRFVAYDKHRGATMSVEQVFEGDDVFPSHVYCGGDAFNALTFTSCFILNLSDADIEETQTAISNDKDYKIFSKLDELRRTALFDCCSESIVENLPDPQLVLSEALSKITDYVHRTTGFDSLDDIRVGSTDALQHQTARIVAHEPSVKFGEADTLTQRSFSNDFRRMMLDHHDKFFISCNVMCGEIAGIMHAQARFEVPGELVFDDEQQAADVIKVCMQPKLSVRIYTRAALPHVQRFIDEKGLELNVFGFRMLPTASTSSFLFLPYDTPLVEEGLLGAKGVGSVITLLDSFSDEFGSLFNAQLAERGVSQPYNVLAFGIAFDVVDAVVKQAAEFIEFI